MRTERPLLTKHCIIIAVLHVSKARSHGESGSMGFWRTRGVVIQFTSLETLTV